jgi:hypothetical protein
MKEDKLKQGLMELTESEAFEEFIFSRCEEIILCDKECNSMTLEVLKSESELKNALTKEHLRLYIKHEQLINSLNSRKNLLLYRAGFNDRIGLK